MMKTEGFNRSPVYADDHMTRVISGPNGTWFYQKKVAEKGTKDTDCWVTEMAFDNFVKARGQL
jgi:hypothetical protein